MRLTTAELLKNYFFNRENEQAFKECWEDVFEPTAEKREYWEQEIVTGRIKRTLVDLFFDAFLQILVQDKRRGVTTEDKLFYSRTSNLFQSYKDFIAKYCDGSKDEVLGAMKAYAEVFESTFDPTCCDRNVSSAPSAERMNVLIFGLKNSTLIPYVLYVRKNVESSDEQAKIFATLESYIVRRMLVRATTKNYNRLFTSLILNEAKDAAALRTALAADAEATTYMPSDPEVRAAFGESCLYNLQSKGVLYLLESAIRPSMSSTALLGFNQYTLEHMMPKKWRNKWEPLMTRLLREGTGSSSRSATSPSSLIRSTPPSAMPSGSSRSKGKDIRTVWRSAPPASPPWMASWRRNHGAKRTSTSARSGLPTRP